MPVGFLTEDRRQQYGRFGDDPTDAQLARHCHLDDADRARLATREVDHNRLGFAVQLCTVRILGTFLADPQAVPGVVVAYVARQLGINNPACFADYRHPQVHQRHAREIRETHGYRQFNDQPYHFLLTRWLFTRAWLSGDRPITLFDAATEWLIERKVLLPGASTLERLVARARDRADGRLWRTRLNALIRAVEKHGKPRDEAIIKLLRYTGLRVGELCALTRDDIYLSERKGALTVRSGKRGKFRIVPLHTEARQALEAYDQVRRKIEGADDHVFISQRTRRGITPRAVERLVAKYARLAGLEEVTPHTLRHSFGKDALGAGMDVVTVAALLGHENLKTTMIYTRPSEDELQVAIDRIGVA